MPKVAHIVPYLFANPVALLTSGFTPGSQVVALPLAGFPGPIPG